MTESLAFLPVDALEKSKTSMQDDQLAWFDSAWGVKKRLHLEDLVSDMGTFFGEHDLRDLCTTVSHGAFMVWMGWFAILRRRGSKQNRIPEVLTEPRTLLKVPVGKYIECVRLNTYPELPHFKQDSMRIVWGGFP